MASGNAETASQINAAIANTINNSAPILNIASTQNVFQNQGLDTNSSEQALSPNSPVPSNQNQIMLATGTTNSSTLTNTLNSIPMSTANQNVATNNLQFQAFNHSQSNFAQTASNPVSLIQNSSKSSNQNLLNQANLALVDSNINSIQGTNQNTLSNSNAVNLAHGATNQNTASSSSSIISNQNKVDQVFSTNSNQNTVGPVLSSSSNQNTVGQIFSQISNNNKNSNQNSNTVVSNNFATSNKINQLTTNNASQSNSLGEL